MFVFLQFPFGISKRFLFSEKSVHDFEKCFNFVKLIANLDSVCVSQTLSFLKKTAFKIPNLIQICAAYWFFKLGTAI